MPISAGIPAPDFEMLDDTNTPRKLSDYRGKNVVLYFYPKDDTPGCTKEACNFRDDYSAYEKSGVVILGVSPDSVSSHVKFKKKFQLQFPLLAVIFSPVFGLRSWAAISRILPKSLSDTVKDKLECAPLGGDCEIMSTSISASAILACISTVQPKFLSCISNEKRVEVRIARSGPKSVNFLLYKKSSRTQDKKFPHF